MPKVNCKILEWARETAGLTLENAVKKLDIHQARGVSAIDRLISWESGEVEPPRSLLKDSVDLY